MTTATLTGEGRQSGRSRCPRWIIAERRVAEILKQLPMDKFIVMNDIKFKYGNIDHLVIRDDGVLFLIETKSYSGHVTFDGRQLLFGGKPSKRNYLCQMNRNIRWLRQFTRRMWRRNPWFVAILVFPNAKVGIGRSAKQVSVLELKNLQELIFAQERA